MDQLQGFEQSDTTVPGPRGPVQRTIGGARPSDTLWWSLSYLVSRAELHTLRSLHARLVESGTTSRVRQLVEDEISRRI